MLKRVSLIALLVLIGTVLPGLVLIPAQYLGVDPSELQGSGFKLTLANALTILVFSGAMIVFVYLVQRYIHRQPFLALGFKRAWAGDLAKGHLIGGLLAGLPLGGALWMAEDVHISSAIPPETGGMLLTGYVIFFLFMLTLNSLKEELLFRSYPLENIGEASTSTWATILIASVIFSLVHLVLEPFTWTAFISRFLFGVFTCQVYLATRSIWPIVGIHNGSNWVYITVSANWKMGGVLSVTEGPEALAFESDPIYSIISRTLAVIICAWIMHRRRDPVTE